MVFELKGLEAERIRESVEEIRRRIFRPPRIGLVLGSGWGGVRDLIENPVAIPLSEIPGFPRPRVSGHAGQLLFGRLGSLEIVIVAGRKHLYEGEGLGPVLYPIEVLRQLGVEVLGLTNAAGAANPEFSIGDLMVIEDHLDSTWHRYTAALEALPGGDAWVNRNEPVYDREFAQRLLEIGKSEGLPVQSGVYAFTLGPFYESPAEVRCLGSWGADALGMSTVPEAIFARLRGMRVFGLSGITNMGTGLSVERHSHETVKQQADLLAPRATRLLKRFLETLESITGK